jgi:hypothetical protein
MNGCGCRGRADADGRPLCKRPRECSELRAAMLDSLEVLFPVHVGFYRLCDEWRERLRAEDAP